MLNLLPRRCNFLLWICVLALICPLAIAQTASPTASTPAPQPDGQQSSPESSTQGSASSTQGSDLSPDLIFAPTLDHPQVKELGGGGRFLTDDLDWLHWGSLGVRSAEVFYTNFAENTGGNSADVSAATFQTNIAYNKRFQRSRVIWQYSPRVLLVNGSVGKELSNQDSTLDLMFSLSSRWTAGITNWFSFYGRDNTLSDRSLDRNSVSGAILNPFLNNGQQTLLDSIAFPVSYNSSARTSISVAPFFSYARASEGVDPTLSVQPGVLTMYQYGARTQITHVVSGDLSIGGFYTYQAMQQSPSHDDTLYQSFGATFSRRLGRTLYASGELGGSYSDQRQFKSWTGVASLSLTKTFRRSSFQGTVGRDASFSGLFGSGYSDFAWANYNRDVSRKIRAGAGFGYLSGPSLGKTAKGKYVNGTVSYALRPSLSWFFVYARLWQEGAGVQVLPGTQTQFQVGLRWSPARKTAY